MVGFVVRNAVMASCASAAMAALAAPAVAADLTAPAPYVVPAAPVILPANYNAVSTVNAKFDIAGGYEWGDKFSNHALGKISGAIAFPIGPEFGVQIDASAAATRGDLGRRARRPRLLAQSLDRPARHLCRRLHDPGAARQPERGPSPASKANTISIASASPASPAWKAATAPSRAPSSTRWPPGMSRTISASMRAIRTPSRAGQGRAGLEYQLPPSSGWGHFALFGEGRRRARLRLGAWRRAGLIWRVEVALAPPPRGRPGDTVERELRHGQPGRVRRNVRAEKNNKPTCTKADRPCKPE